MAVKGSYRAPSKGFRADIKAGLKLMRSQELCGCFYKIGGPFLRCPDNKSPENFGSILVFGNSLIALILLMTDVLHELVHQH